MDLEDILSIRNCRGYSYPAVLYVRASDSTELQYCTLLYTVYTVQHVGLTGKVRAPGSNSLPKLYLCNVHFRGTSSSPAQNSHTVWHFDSENNALWVFML